MLMSQRLLLAESYFLEVPGYRQLPYHAGELRNYFLQYLRIFTVNQLLASHF